jgi:tripartite-type tricarboxylate transporter receptor subunit TctC
MMNRRSACSLAALALCSPSVLAQSYPARPVHIVVPFTAGGGVDIITRLLAQKLTWPQGVVIENKPGAGSILGTSIVARSAPDGYTLLMTAPPFTTNAALVAKLPYDPMADFTPVMLTTYAPLVVVVHPSVPARSIRELIALAKSRPGQLSYASSGNGGPSHLAGELFKSMAGVDMVHVPYKGSAPAAADLVAGHVQVGFGDLLSSLPFIKSGQIRAIAVTSAKRSTVFADLPTVAESGMPEFETLTWSGLMAPAGTPPAVIAVLNAEVARALKAPEVRDRLAGEGTTVVADDPASFKTFIRNEIDKVTRLSKVATIKID